MANSLLAHMYSHIKGSQEDVATWSLQYILSQSDDLAECFNQLIGERLKCTVDKSIRYVCQSVGENNERPDMAGRNADGTEVILCEAKFYAGLTDNQPLAYLDRLRNNGGTGLIFICPRARLINLHKQLEERIAERHYQWVDSGYFDVDGVKLAVISWHEILELLHRTAAVKAPECLSDIDQLDGYCRQMDSDAFVPFKAEDLGADVARSIQRYIEVVDATIDLLNADASLNPSLKGVKATAYRKGYTRSMHIGSYAITFNYDRDLWKRNTSVVTPFWVAIRTEDWDQDQSIMDAMNAISDSYKEDFWNMVFIALTSPTDATLIEIAESLKQQILSYIELVKKYRK